MHIPVTRCLWLFLICYCCSAGAAETDADQLSGTVPSQWRLMWLSDPATTATIAWTTAEAGQSHAVLLRPRGQAAADDQTLACTRSGAYSGGTGQKPRYYHIAELTGLSSGTAYEIQLVSDEQRSPRMYFVTAPREQRPFSILFGGDSRSDPAQRRTMNRLMGRLVWEGSQSGRPEDEILALAHGGDYVYDGKKLSQWLQWMSDHELTVAEDGRLLPLIPARGNHDRGEIFQEVFGFPPESKNYFHTIIGPQLGLLTLNTETTIAGDQKKWLTEQLAELRPRCRWLIVQYHRPAYPAIKFPSRALLHWVPLFDQFRVDLVCEADGHVIKRTVPIRRGRQDDAGVVFIGEGGLGVSQRTPKSRRWYLQPPGMAATGHHVQKITLTDDRLIYHCLGEDGEVLDRYERLPRSPSGGGADAVPAVTAQPSSHP